MDLWAINLGTLQESWKNFWSVFRNIYKLLLVTWIRISNFICSIQKNLNVPCTQIFCLNKVIGGLQLEIHYDESIDDKLTDIR